MSFDLYFVADASEEGRQAALKELELRAGEECEPSPADLALWDRLRGPVKNVLPESTEAAGARYRQFDDEASGIQLTMSLGEISLTVPYWTEGEEANETVALLTSAVAAVQEATGLVAFDPQSKMPFLSGGADAAPATFDRARAALRSHLQ